MRGGRDGLREQGELGGEPGPGPPQHLAAPGVPAGRVGEDEVARPVPAQQRARPLERPGEDGAPRLRDPDHPGAEQEVGIVDPQAWRRLVARGIGRGQPPGGGPDGERRAVGGGEHGGEVERHLGGLDGVRGPRPAVASLRGSGDTSTAAATVVTPRSIATVGPSLTVRRPARPRH